MSNRKDSKDTSKSNETNEIDGSNNGSTLNKSRVRHSNSILSNCGISAFRSASSKEDNLQQESQQKHKHSSKMNYFKTLQKKSKSKSSSSPPLLSPSSCIISPPPTSSTPTKYSRFKSFPFPIVNSRKKNQQLKLKQTEDKKLQTDAEEEELSKTSGSASADLEEKQNQNENQKQTDAETETIKMAGDADSVVSLYRELKNEWNKKNCNLQKCGAYLDKLKIELTKLSFLPTAGISIPKQDLIIARDVLEIAVEYSVAKKDIPAFERYTSQLKCYYYDYRKIIGESENMYKQLGLNLLYLLSVNRVSEFHTELELLSTEVIQKNRYIRPILGLEQYIMEGRYNKIFQARGSLPADLYNFFMDILVETVRDEIGACLEKSYEKISLQEAAKRLNLKTKEEVKTFGAKRNWSLGPDGVYYFVTKAAKPKEPLPSLELAEQAIFYARELETIV